MSKDDAIFQAKQIAAKWECSHYVILCNDGDYIVSPRKPLLGNVNRTYDVTRVDADGRLYLA